MVRIIAKPFLFCMNEFLILYHLAKCKQLSLSLIQKEDIFLCLALSFIVEHIQVYSIYCLPSHVSCGPGRFLSFEGKIPRLVSQRDVCGRESCALFIYLVFIFIQFMHSTYTYAYTPDVFQRRESISKVKESNYYPQLERNSLSSQIERERKSCNIDYYVLHA
jgi:hypothetical protein